MKTIVEMKFKKDTKRTVVYINEEEGVAISQVYIQKSALTPVPPQEITLTLEAKQADIKGVMSSLIGILP